MTAFFQKNIHPARISPLFRKNLSQPITPPKPVTGPDRRRHLMRQPIRNNAASACLALVEEASLKVLSYHVQTSVHRRSADCGACIGMRMGHGFFPHGRFQGFAEPVAGLLVVVAPFREADRLAGLGLSGPTEWKLRNKERTCWRSLCHCKETAHRIANCDVFSTTYGCAGGPCHRSTGFFSGWAPGPFGAFRGPV